jgi:hypothetical protein
MQCDGSSKIASFKPGAFGGRTGKTTVQRRSIPETARRTIRFPLVRCRTEFTPAFQVCVRLVCGHHPGGASRTHRLEHDFYQRGRHFRTPPRGAARDGNAAGARLAAQRRPPAQSYAGPTASLYPRFHRGCQCSRGAGRSRAALCPVGCCPGPQRRDVAGNDRRSHADAALGIRFHLAGGNHDEREPVAAQPAPVSSRTWRMPGWPVRTA